MIHHLVFSQITRCDGRYVVREVAVLYEEDVELEGMIGAIRALVAWLCRFCWGGLWAVDGAGRIDFWILQLIMPIDFSQILKCFLVNNNARQKLVEAGRGEKDPRGY